MKTFAILVLGAGLVVASAASAHPHFSSGGGMGSGAGRVTSDQSNMKVESTDGQHWTDGKNDRRDMGRTQESRHETKELVERLERLVALKLRLERDLHGEVGDKGHIRREIVRLIEKIERIERLVKIDDGKTGGNGPSMVGYNITTQTAE